MWLPALQGKVGECMKLGSRLVLKNIADTLSAKPRCASAFYGLPATITMCSLGLFVVRAKYSWVSMETRIMNGL